MAPEKFENGRNPFYRPCVSKLKKIEMAYVDLFKVGSGTVCGIMTEQREKDCYRGEQI